MDHKSTKEEAHTQEVEGVSSMEIRLTPIGIVVEGIPREPRHGSRYMITSKIRIFDEYRDGLRGLEEYSHAIIIFWMHEVEEVRLLDKPRHAKDAPVIGVFASRSPRRPNPLGVTVVELERVEGPILYVRGLDAWPGTPVLDIKPYDYHDIVKCPRTPPWVEDRWRASRELYGRIAPSLGPCC